MGDGSSSADQKFLQWMMDLGARQGITLEMTLDEADIDSLTLLEWAFNIEDHTGQQISDELLIELRSVGDLCHYWKALTLDQSKSDSQ
jgi:acyl carrier protein